MKYNSKENRIILSQRRSIHKISQQINRKNLTVKYLQIQGLQIDQHIISKIPDKWPQLRIIKIKNCKIESKNDFWFLFQPFRQLIVEIYFLESLIPYIGYFGFEWKQLKVLVIQDTYVNKNQAKAMSMVSFPKLDSLTIKKANLSDQEIFYLSKSRWSTLRQLILINNNISNKSLKYLSQSKFSRLENINLSQNYLTPSSFSQLIVANWKNVNKLQLDYMKVNRKIDYHNQKFLLKTNLMQNNLKNISLKAVIKKRQWEKKLVKKALRSKCKNLNIVF